jgi:hypothetical protein
MYADTDLLAQKMLFIALRIDRELPMEPMAAEFALITLLIILLILVDGIIRSRSNSDHRQG